jgi:hypothetical protein
VRRFEQQDECPRRRDLDLVFLVDRWIRDHDDCTDERWRGLLT